MKVKITNAFEVPENSEPLSTEDMLLEDLIDSRINTE